MHVADMILALPSVGTRAVLRCVCETPDDARRTHGTDKNLLSFPVLLCSHCRLRSLVWQAAVKASLDGAKAITTEALEWAKDKILMGAERRSAVISEETAKCTAFHEGGHAIVVRENLRFRFLFRACVFCLGYRHVESDLAATPPPPPVVDTLRSYFV